MEAAAARVDGAAQKILSKPARKQVPNVGSVRCRPLAGKSFYLDLPSGKKLDFLAKCVRRLGGVVESFLSKEVTCVVSNNQEARKERCGGKQTTTVLRNTSSGTQTSGGRGRGHGDPSCKPSDTALVTRGKALLQKAIGIQSNTCGSNSILATARSWGVQIMHMDEMVHYIQRLDARMRHSVRQMKLFPSGSQSTVKVMRLRSPFLKVEDESRQLRPLLQRFKDFPELYFVAHRGQSPFDPPRPPTRSKAPDALMAPSDLPSDCCFVLKTRRGYCECCEETFAELQTHLQSPRHMAFVLDASHYTAVDGLISQMTNDFADSSSLSRPLRVPLAGDGDFSGFQEDILERATAFSGQLERYSVFCEGSMEQSVIPGSSTHLLENQSFWQEEEFAREKINGPASLTRPSLQAASCRTGGGDGSDEHRRRGGGGGGGVAEALLPASSWVTLQPKNPWVPPTLLPPHPRKRKCSHSPCGLAKKRAVFPGWALSHPLPDHTAGPGTPPADAPEHAFSREGSTPPDPGCLPQFSHESSRWFLREHAVLGSSCLEGLVQPREQRERSAVGPEEERNAWTPGKGPSTEAQWSTPGSLLDKHSPPQRLAAVLQPCFPDVVLEPLGPGRLPVSSSEWDGPLFFSLDGASHLPFKPPLDSALLGTRISMRDSGYESRLASALWQSVEPPEGCEEGDSGSCHSHLEAEWTPLSSLGAYQDRRGPLSLNKPAPLPS